MIKIRCALLCVLLSLQIAQANVEKIIFIAPAVPETTESHPTFSNIELEALSPRYRTGRTQLHAEFPTNLSPKGVISWVLLEDLTEGQRYEFRVCWAATQPTLFKLIAFNITGAFEEPELVASLVASSQSRPNQLESIGYPKPNISRPFKDSSYYSGHRKPAMLIQIFAVADYYTTNRTLMDQVPSVVVDITLDPYILNIYPESFLGTGLYLLIIATGSWYFANMFAEWLKAVGKLDDAKKNALQGKSA